jgi:cell division protein ZapA (FtsZ GTPase activity inhibitor)
MSTSPDTVTLKATVGAQQYSLRVGKETEPEVNQAIAMVNDRFNAILNAGKIASPERIAVMVALNLAVELNKAKSAPSVGFDFPNTNVASLRENISHLLRS